MPSVIRKDTPAALNADGAHTSLQVDASGNLRVIAASGVAAADLGKAEDAAHSSGATGIMALAVRKDTAAALAGTDADYIPLIVDSTGRLWVHASSVDQLPAALAAGGGLKVEGVSDGVAQPVSAAQLPAELAAGGGLKVEGVSGGVAMPVTEGWTTAVASIGEGDDSDLAFTVPEGQEWMPISLYVQLTTTAKVGNRQILVVIMDPSDAPIARMVAGAVQPASCTRTYMFGVGCADLLSFRDTSFLMTPIPPWIIPAGHDLRVLDVANIDADGDDMVVNLIYSYRTV